MRRPSLCCVKPVSWEVCDGEALHAACSLSWQNSFVDLACDISWHLHCSGPGIIYSIQYRKQEIVLPVFSVFHAAVLVVDVHSTVTSNRLDHSLLVPVRGCTGMILSGFQSVRLPLNKKQNKKK